MSVPATATANALRAWDLICVEPDVTVHNNVEVRELQLDPRGAHLTHVRLYGGRGARIVGTTHDDEHETIMVLTGTVVADIGGKEYIGTPGTIFNIPQGMVHGYTPLHGSTVELLAIYAPSM